MRTPSTHLQVCRRFIKKAYRETYSMYHPGAGQCLLR